MIWVSFGFLSSPGDSGETMSFYGEREGSVRPVLQVAMPRLPRLYAPSRSKWTPLVAAWQGRMVL